MPILPEPCTDEEATGIARVRSSAVTFMQDEFQGDLAKYVQKLRDEVAETEQMAQNAVTGKQQVDLKRLAARLGELADRVEWLFVKRVSGRPN